LQQYSKMALAASQPFEFCEMVSKIST